MPNLCSTVFAPNVVQQLERQIPSIAGFSLRLASSHAHYAWLESYRSLLSNSQTLALFAFGLALASLFLENVWASVGLFYFVMALGLFSSVVPRLQWRSELVQLPVKILLGLPFGVALFVVFQFFLPFDIQEGWEPILNEWRNWLPALFFLLLFVIPVDEILWGTVVLPFVASFACGKTDHGKIGLVDDGAKRGLGYTPCFLFSLFYGAIMCMLFKVSPFAPTYGLLIFAFVGLAECVLVLKTERVLAGMVCKVVLWVAALLWTS